MRRLGLGMLMSAMVCATGCGRTSGSVIVVNHASRAIVGADIEVCRQHVKVGRIDVGGSSSADFVIRGDSGYKIDVKLEGDGMVHDELGYVTDGIESVDSLIVTDAGIRIARVGAVGG
jgi:hypothetical protein